MGAVYATPADLADRWRPLTPAEEQRAVTLLADAAVRIRAACRDVDARLAAAPPLLDGEIPLIVSCEMVKRAMLATVDQPAASQMQQTAGPFSQSVTYANPAGDLYLTKAERKLLGCGQQAAFTVPLASAPGAVHRPWCALAFGATYCSCGADIAGEPIFEAG